MAAPAPKLAGPLHPPFAVPLAAVPSSLSGASGASAQASSWSSNRPLPRTNNPPGGQVTMNQQGQLIAQTVGAGLQRQAQTMAAALGPRGQQAGRPGLGGALRQGPEQGGTGQLRKGMPSSGSAESLEILGSNPGQQPSGVTSHAPTPRTLAPQLGATPQDMARQQQAQRGPPRPTAGQGINSGAPQQAAPPHLQRQAGDEAGPSPQQLLKVWSGQLALLVKGQELPLCYLEVSREDVGRKCRQPESCRLEREVSCGVFSGIAAHAVQVLSRRLSWMQHRGLVSACAQCARLMPAGVVLAGVRVHQQDGHGAGERLATQADRAESGQAERCAVSPPSLDTQQGIWALSKTWG